MVLIVWPCMTLTTRRTTRISYLEFGHRTVDPVSARQDSRLGHLEASRQRNNKKPIQLNWYAHVQQARFSSKCQRSHKTALKSKTSKRLKPNMIKVSSALSAQAIGLNHSKSGLLFTSRFTSVRECDGSTDGSTVIVQSRH